MLRCTETHRDTSKTHKTRHRGQDPAQRTHHPVQSLFLKDRTPQVNFLGGKNKTRPQNFQHHVRCMVRSTKLIHLERNVISWRNVKFQIEGETVVYFDSADKCVVTMQSSNNAMLQHRQESHTQSCYNTIKVSAQLILNGLKPFNRYWIENVKSKNSSIER